MYARMTNRDTADAVNMVEEEKLWHPGGASGVGERFPSGDMEGVSSELFGLLVNSTEGEDFQTVKMEEDCRGFQTWWKLTHRRAPRSMARAVMLVGLVAPPKVPDLAKVESEVQVREHHQRTLVRKFRETFSGGQGAHLASNVTGAGARLRASNPRQRGEARRDRGAREDVRGEQGSSGVQVAPCANGHRPHARRGLQGVGR